MINEPKDPATLAAEMRELEKRGEFLSNELDGADLLTILAILSEDDDEYENSHQWGEIIRATQSNPNEAFRILQELRELDDKIAAIDEELTAE